MSTTALDLGMLLRALRRRADLSQRELAERAGVPQPTLARIESGRAVNPSFRTVERLARAAGEAVTVGPAAPVPVVPVPQEGLRDRAGRRYPAHLDIEEVIRPERWWGAWWTLTVIRSRWPLDTVPPYTYDRSRYERDLRRGRAARGRRVHIRRAGVRGLDEPGGLWLAEEVSLGAEGEHDGASVKGAAGDPAGRHPARVGEARAHHEPRRGVVLDGVVVSRQWRRCGIGRRLVEAVRDYAAGLPVTAVADGWDGGEFLRACGFTYAGAAGSRWVCPAEAGTDG